ncbi:LANO_0B00980g1_1 [Lachancea nothofagi CBS 11611]|uniref:LANO_0B00980g1_1 n=1 Tax=Lachancea nothofagi CBS 11611 TaxID=1266666 RepID=A0A1G4IV23_9SACH|nr:LANO_0B00980g1_1 [Lachancea nothofagi CBS 11611]
MAANSSNQLAIYERSLEREIDNKEYFLQQVTDALAKLKSSGPDTKLNSDQDLWIEFLGKPMFSPDRSDPIGLSLAFCENRTRLKTSREYLESDSLEPLREILATQESLNQGVQTLTTLLNQRLSENSPQLHDRQQDGPETRNSNLWRILHTLIENFVAIDLCPDGADSDLVAERMQNLMKRLIKRDESLTANDFEGNYSSGLYRLLLRSNCLCKSQDGSHIHLINFLDEF